MALTRNLFVPLLDSSKGASGLESATWVQIDKSTQFALAYNPNTETVGYICNKNDSTNVTGYAPELPQEIVLDKDNPLYKFMDAHINSFPTGADAEIPFLFVRPSLEDGQPTVGLAWEHATVLGDTLDTVEGKLSFTINLNGDPVKGTVTGIGTPSVKFQPSEA